MSIEVRNLIKTFDDKAVINDISFKVSDGEILAIVGFSGSGKSTVLKLISGLSFRAYFTSVWLGLYMKDLWVSISKAATFGGTIALISCACGYHASGGAKGVGLATTKAVVWSFIAIVIWDMVFAMLFFF